MLTALFMLPVFVGAAQAAPTPLAAHRTVYVRPVAENDIHESFAEALREWGRWRVVDRQEDAALIARLGLSGGWSVGEVTLRLEDAKTGQELWVSKKQKGHRAIWNNYQNPHKRAMNGIMEQLRKASEKWPNE